MRRRIGQALNKQVTMPRWAIGLDFVYRVFLVVSAAVVIVLWWQAATRDEEADRNARIQSCSSEYAATYSAWDARAGDLFGQLIAVSVESDADPPPDLLADYTEATANAAEIASLRIGLAQYAAESVADGGNTYECPPLPERLMVEAIAPVG